jgi:gluconokinase
MANEPSISPSGNPPVVTGAVLVMGVSGCGKSTLGRDLAARLDCPFLEGDTFHPATNIAKMAHGIPLTDADRWPWLDSVGAALGAAVRERGRGVGACSALTRAYRNRLIRAAGMSIRFVHLTGSRELLASRMAVRPGHFMPPSLLDSQLATLEPPQGDEAAMTLDIALSRSDLLERALAWLLTQ